MRLHIHALCGLIVMLLCSAIALSYAADLSGQKSAQVTAAQLQLEVQKHNLRIAQLEQRQGIAVLPQLKQAPNQEGSVPGSWIQKEFNGVHYYIVPLDRSQGE